jgi:sulfur-oxidizing protein SoxY
MISRRGFTASLIAAPALAQTPCDPGYPDALVRALFGARLPVLAGVQIDMPRLAETGNSVPITVQVESPMLETDYVRRIVVLVPGNPEPLAADVTLWPLAGAARFSTRLRLARTQTVRVLAEHSDGRLHGAELPVLVTLGACIDELWTD